jgi:hypothetical protein
MNMHEHLEPEVDGVDPKQFVELEGCRGSFFAAPSAGRPELEIVFFYGDNLYQFFFFVTTVKSGNTDEPDELIVYGASNKKLGFGGNFIAKCEDVAYLEENIRRLFQTRVFYNLKKSTQINNRIVKFTWRIAE